MLNQRSVLRHRIVPPSLRTPATQLPLRNSKTQSSVKNLIARVAHWASLIVHRFAR
jgi:hypothetical protein